MDEPTASGSPQPGHHETEPVPPDGDVPTLQAIISQKDRELNALQAANESLQQKIEVSREQIDTAVDRYRHLLLSMHPEISPEMINGTDISELDAALTRASDLVARVRQSVLQELAQNRIPTGVNGRQTADLSTLSPREKIHLGIGGKQ